MSDFLRVPTSVAVDFAVVVTVAVAVVVVVVVVADELVLSN